MKATAKSKVKNAHLGDFYLLMVSALHPIRIDGVSDLETLLS